jgi:hypothetical protein
MRGASVHISEFGDPEINRTDDIEDFERAFEAAARELDDVILKLSEEQNGVGHTIVPELNESIFGDHLVMGEIDRLIHHIVAFGPKRHEGFHESRVSDEITLIVESPAVLAIGRGQKQERRPLLRVVMKVDQQVIFDPLFFSGQSLLRLVNSTGRKCRTHGTIFSDLKFV